MRPIVLRNIILPTALFLLAISITTIVGLDLQLADYLYALEGGQWSLKNAWFTKALIHEQGRVLVGITLLALLSCIALSYRLERLRRFAAGAHLSC